MARTPIEHPGEAAPEPPLYEIIDLPRIPDRRGTLSVVEGLQQVPFEIARVYYLYDVPSSASRAGHAHRQLTQLIIPTSGSFSVKVDNGREKADVQLDRPYRGLLLRPMVWRLIDNFSAGATCLVIASLPYDEADYIRDYKTFLKISRA